MLTNIEKYISLNYPKVKIVSASVVPQPKIKSKDDNIPHIDFYDITFEFNGKKFSKLFHTKHHESIEQQFKEALSRCKIDII